MNEKSKIYEEPTNELRQVRHTEWAGDHLLVYYKVQQRWLVPTGEIYASNEGPKDKDHLILPFIHRLDALVYEVPRYAVAREEWRDLPEINAEDLQKSV